MGSDDTKSWGCTIERMVLSLLITSDKFQFVFVVHMLVPPLPTTEQEFLLSHGLKTGKKNG